MFHWLVRKARYYEFKDLQWWERNEPRFRRYLTGRYLAISSGVEVVGPFDKEDISKKCFLIGTYHLILGSELDMRRLAAVYQIIDYLDYAARKEYNAQAGTVH